MTTLLLPGKDTLYIPRPPQWTSYTPTLTATTTDPTLGTGGIAQGSYLRTELGLIIYRFYFQFGTSGVNAGSGGYRVSLPVNISSDSPSNNVVGLGAGVAFDWSVAGVRRYVTPSRDSTFINRLQLNMEDAQVSHNAPWAWDIDDRFGCTVVYQEA